jgi:osmotically-inducible protein OsmY
MSKITLAASIAAALFLSGCVQPAASPEVSAAPVKLDRSRTEMNRDDGIARVVVRSLTDADRTAFRSVSAEVFNGRALLMGAVTKPEQRRRAEQVAKEVQGISEVVNELVLAEDTALAAFATQPGLDMALRGKLLSTEGITGFYATRVVNGVAYVMGVSPNTAENERVKALVLDSPGVKWAVLHVKLAQ